jgi:hypothetical protein
MIKLELHGNSKFDLWVPHLKHSRRVLRTLQSLQKRLKGGQHLRLAGRKSPVFGAVKGMFDMLPPEARAGMTIEKAVFSLARSMFGVEPPPEVAAAATPAGRPTPEQFRTGGVAPPTQRRGSDKAPGREKAIDDAKAWWDEQTAQGGAPADGGTSMTEFLPF